MIKTKISFISYIPFLILISFASFLNIIARVIFAPLTPYICEEMHLCHAETGSLFFILSIGFAITLFGSQFLSSKITHKTTTIISIILTGFTLSLISCTETLSLLLCLFFFLGLCSGLFIPSAVAMIRETVPIEHLGKAFGIFATSQSVAFIIAPVAVKYFIAYFSWKNISNGLGLFSSIISLGMIFFLKKGQTKGEPITLSFMRDVFCWPSFWILMILLCLANGLNIGIYNMAPDYFQCHNLLDANIMYKLTIIARVISVLTAILAGILADRFGLKHSLALSFIFGGVLTLLMGSMNPSSSLAIFCLQSPVATCLMPLIHFGVSTIAPPEKNAAIVSITAPFGFLFGGGIVPQVLGFLGDINMYAQGFILFGTTSIVCGIIFNINAIYRHIELSQIKSELE